MHCRNARHARPLTMSKMTFCAPQAQEGIGVPLPVIRQSLCFAQLRHLWLHVEGLINLDNDRLFEAVSSWPHIELLKVDHFYDEPIPRTIRGAPSTSSLAYAAHIRGCQEYPKEESFQHLSLCHSKLGASLTRDPEGVAHHFIDASSCRRSCAQRRVTVNEWFARSFCLHQFRYAIPVCATQGLSFNLCLQRFLVASFVRPCK
jgi:hypothetical protein